MLLRPALPGVKPTLCTRWRGVASAAPADGASGGSRCAGLIGVASSVAALAAAGAASGVAAVSFAGGVGGRPSNSRCLGLSAACALTLALLSRHLLKVFTAARTHSAASRLRVTPIADA